MKLVMTILVSASTVLVLLAVYAWVRTHVARNESTEGENWELTLYQKMEYFSIDDIVHGLTSANVIGTGSSGVVYRVTTRKGETVAVKKMWSSEEDRSGEAFRSEIQTLGSIRHKNIVRLLGWGSNGAKKLLFYDYLPNGTLSSLIHGAASKGGAKWETRYEVLLGVAHALAYLHHDCVPPIVHRDIKANNILIGLEFEPYIADFGLAKLVEDGDFGRSSNTVAGSYGYIAPEYGYMMKITEKSDVYSYGVVVLEVLTGKQPIDPTIPDGLHLVDWVRRKRGGIEVLDPTLLSRLPESGIEEMRQALGIALLCVNSSPDERPSMKDVAAMLKEIKHEREEFAKVDMLLRKGSSDSKNAGETRNSGGGVPTATSSSTKAMQISLYPKSNNTSFSASSLLYSSS